MLPLIRPLQPAANLALRGLSQGNPAHAAFGGYKKSGVGRETHKMMLDHYQQTKNLLISYDINPLGFF